MSCNIYPHKNIQSSVSRLRISAPVISFCLKLLAVFSVIFFSSQIFAVLTVISFNSIMLLSGIIEDLPNVNHLINEDLLSELVLTDIIHFFVQPAMSGCLLIGLFWLFFIIFPALRAAIVLRKTAFEFSESLQSFIGLHTHGCRAPPSYK
ncbi:hypothetical protein ACOYR1_10460 [Thalassotalea piscium]